MIKGLVFDIKRFAVHDGKGIRTTIFLKGCPLSCVWCQNPEGLSPKPKIIYHQNRCKHFLNCIKLAPNNIDNNKNNITITNQDFDKWDQVIYNCPTNAITYDSKYYSVEELMTEIKKDLPFYKNGGGVTFSGGEPLFQYDFLIAMLKACQNININTCIETSGYVSTEKFTKLLSYLDSIYMDFKIYDNTQHKLYTNVENQQIKSNLKILLQSNLKTKAIIRTPMILNITNTQENIESIASFLSSIYPKTQYELLNFNPLAFSKYQLTSKKYYFKENPPRFSEEEMNQFRAYARKYLNNIIVS